MVGNIRQPLNPKNCEDHKCALQGDDVENCRDDEIAVYCSMRGSSRSKAKDETYGIN